MTTAQWWIQSREKKKKKKKKKKGPKVSKDSERSEEVRPVRWEIEEEDFKLGGCPEEDVRNPMSAEQ